MASSAAGGALNFASFDRTLLAGRYPSPSALEYEGMYHKYQFETGEERERLFAPVFSAAYSRDPISKRMEAWLCVGMNSCLDGDGLKRHGGRPKLNLVLVVDISGSMGDKFERGDTLTKLAVAADAINTGLLPQLKHGDALSIVLFDTRADVLLPMTKFEAIDQMDLKKSVAAMKTRGGTTLMAGVEAAEAQLKSTPDWQNVERENRIVFMTDMQISGEKSLFDAIRRLSNERIYITVVGIGMDFDTDVTKELGVIRACNYLGVKSAKEFKKMMNEQFDYLVTIACTDLEIKIASGSVKIERVYGSPGNDSVSGDVLCALNSSYPSLKESPTLTQGGVMLLKLAEPLPVEPLEFVVTLKDAKGNLIRQEYSFTMPPRSDQELYQGSAVRKAIALTRFVSLLKAFLTDVAAGGKECSAEAGIPAQVDPRYAAANSTRAPLSAAYAAVFATFTKHFEAEAEALADPKMRDELKTLQDIIKDK